MTRRFDEMSGTWRHDEEEELPALHTGARLSNVRAGGEIPWLWTGRIPLGCVTLLGGDPGVGKTLVALNLAGAASGDGYLTTPPNDWFALPYAALDRGVVYFTAEDSPSVLAGRLGAAKGDPTRCAVVTSVKDYNSRGQEFWRRFTFDDTYDLQSVIEKMNAGLVVFDPFTAFLGAKRRVESERDMRKLIDSLNGIAAQTRSAIVLIHHLGKGSRRNVLTRAADATRTLAAARATLLVMAAPGGEPDERLLVFTKSNLGETRLPMRFRITTPYAQRRRGWEALSEEEQEEQREKWRRGARKYDNAPCVEWLGEEEGVPSALAPTTIPIPPTALEEALAFLRELLAAGAVPATEVGSAAYAQGITPKVLRRARERLGVRIERQGFGQGSRSMWRLAGSPSIHRPQPEGESEESKETEEAEEERDED